MADNQALKARVQAFADRLAREDVNMHGFILSVNGVEKAKAYYAPFREGEPHRMYSVSKTMTALAVGLLTDAGKLRLDDPVCGYFSDWVGPETDGRLLRLTIRDMLRMATCYRKTTYREHVEKVRDLPAAEVEKKFPQFFKLLLTHVKQGFYGHPRHGGNAGWASYRMLGLAGPSVTGRNVPGKENHL